MPNIMTAIFTFDKRFAHWIFPFITSSFNAIARNASESIGFLDLPRVNWNISPCFLIVPTLELSINTPNVSGKRVINPISLITDLPETEDAAEHSLS